MASFGYYADILRCCWKQFTGRLMQGSPPEIAPEVESLLLSLHMDTSHLLKLYQAFHALVMAEIEEDAEEEIEAEVARLEARGEIQAAAGLSEKPLDVEVVKVAREVKVETMINLVACRQRWVEGLLRQILNWGDCEEVVDWDSFLWIMLRFCSLSRIELAQSMFIIIQREMRCPNMHYITADDLNNFYYSRYRLCPIKSFSSADIDFKKLPHSRYYASDFTELVQRFTQLLNPLLHLQQSLQANLPDSEFWESLDRTASFPRRITFEFFTMQSTRVYLYGEPPFRESCDMLAPESLGADAVNQDQWLLRVKSKVKQGGMSQVSVWGEQPPPELFDILERKRLERQANKKRIFLGDTFDVRTAAAADRADASSGTAAATAQPPQPAFAEKRPQQPTGTSAGGVAAQMKATAPGAAAKGLVAGATPLDLSLRAAVLDEEASEPLQVLPPRWMKHCTVAPAPKVWGPDPPLPKMLGRSTQGAVLEEGLPAGWASAADPDSGTTYYYNRSLNRTQWERPDE